MVSCDIKNETSEKNKSQQLQTVSNPKDIHTQCNADSVLINHLDLDIKVDFNQQKILGNALWKIDNKFHQKELHLDTYDLSIDSVFTNGKKANFVLEKFVKHLGQALIIPIDDNTKEVNIYYSTGQHARALQWLTPQQTLGKTQPFLYTQSESIYARSWIPCPDGPGIRFTYKARVQVPKGLMALMSAENPQQLNDSNVYHFNMDLPIPAYLMALAVGDIRFKKIDNRTGVYAEPNMIDKASNELSDMGKMLTVAESLYGPYRWGRYDVIVLPPGFPIGGMENPKLTFATPTIIAGDKSLVNLIAHELAHNWSGNLVTNATWNDFWLNEGFTVYFERRISEAMNDKSYADMLWELGYQDLEATVNDLGEQSNDTKLKLDLTGRDPDDGLTDIAYEKGALFLRLLEDNIGRAKMDAFLKNYFATYAFKTISTEEFLQYLNKHLIKDDQQLKKSLNIDAWVYGSGIPSNAPRVPFDRFNKVSIELHRFLSGNAPLQLNTKNWMTFEWMYFLRKMPDSLSKNNMAKLDKAFHFTNSGNSEIACIWFVIAIKTNYSSAYPALDKFLSSVGRRKFIEPIYEAMMKSGKEKMAKEIYEKYRQNYHPLAQMTLDKLVLKQ
jgi:leukotriene A-4 hydrolase/aminopeptidase